MNVGDRVEYFDPLLQRRVEATVYYRERSSETNQFNTYVRGVPGGVTAIWDSMDIVVLELKAERDYKQMVKDALLRIKDVLGGVEL